MRTGLISRARFQVAWSAYRVGSKWLRHAWLSAVSKPARGIRIAKTRSWPGFDAHPQRYIIQRKDGLIQVIRPTLNGGTNRALLLFSWGPAGWVVGDTPCPR